VRTDIVARLRCPVCGRSLAAPDAGSGLSCPAGHHFDAAKQGYVDLVAGPVRHPGDSAAMVAARADFLAAGHFDFLTAALVRAASRLRAGGLVVDVGAGTGWYLAHLLDGYPQALGLALDVAKPALRRAARAHDRALAARADAWRTLPLADGSADLLVNVFAPRNGAEFARVLRPDGDLLVVVPAAEHLGELVGALGLLRVDPAKDQRLEQSLGGRFTLAHTEELAQPMRLSRDEVTTLVGMGPSAWHQQPEALAAAIAGLRAETAATASVRLHHYRPR
jgi:23S rRNA (guanine745-N1)-methyltransferase